MLFVNTSPDYRGIINIEICLTHRRDQTLNYFSIMVRKRVKNDEEADEVDEAEKKVKKSKKKDFVSNLFFWVYSSKGLFYSANNKYNSSAPSYNCSLY